jgi:hypothetical protein
MAVSFDLRRDIVTVLLLCKCEVSHLTAKARSQIKSWNLEEALKQKGVKRKGIKLRNTCTQNVMINITLTGCYLVKFIKKSEVVLP